MKDIKSHFKFTKRERRGIFFLLALIGLFQVAHILFLQFYPTSHKSNFGKDVPAQAQIDSLRKKAIMGDTISIRPFNPNFLTDYRGYVLGMSPEEIDRLHQHRELGKYVGSAKEFQKVTQVSDSLLATMAPYFKFPKWSTDEGAKGEPSFQVQYKRSGSQSTDDKGPLKDLNRVSAQELRTVYGIGEVLSQRIIKFRDRLGGFLVDSQLYDVYGLEPEVANRVLQQFKVIEKPVIQKININSASARELAKLVYLGRGVSEEIVLYRNGNGPLKSFEELLQIPGFPSEKIDRIILYLSL